MSRRTTCPDGGRAASDEPLVYVTFGSVAGSFPQALPAYGLALSAVAELPVRVLLTVGRDLDLDALPAAPDNVRVERWVPQQDVLGARVGGGGARRFGLDPRRAGRRRAARGGPAVRRPAPERPPRGGGGRGPGGRAGPRRHPSRRSPRCAPRSKRSSQSPHMASAPRRWRPSCAPSRPSTTRYPCCNASVAAKLVCLAVDPTQRESEPVSGQVWLLADNPREPEIVFDFPFDEELNEAVRELPGRWFNWRLKHWRVPADPRLGKLVGGVLERFPALEAVPRGARLAERLGPLAGARVRGHPRRRRGVRAAHASRASRPRACCARAWATGPGGIAASRSAPACARRVADIDGVRLDDLAARERARARAGAERRRRPSSRSRSATTASRSCTVYPGWDPSPAADVPRAARGAPRHRARPLLRPRRALGRRRARRPGARRGDRRVRGEPPAGARGGAGRASCSTS